MRVKRVAATQTNKRSPELKSTAMDERRSLWFFTDNYYWNLKGQMGRIHCIFHPSLFRCIHFFLHWTINTGRTKGCRTRQGVWQATNLEVPVHEVHYKWGSIDHYCVAHSAQWVLEALGFGSTTRNSLCIAVAGLLLSPIKTCKISPCSLYLAILFTNCPLNLSLSFCMDQRSAPQLFLSLLLISLVLLCVFLALSPPRHWPSPLAIFMTLSCHCNNSAKTAQNGKLDGWISSQSNPKWGWDRLDLTWFFWTSPAWRPVSSPGMHAQESRVLEVKTGIDGRGQLMNLKWWDFMSDQKSNNWFNSSSVFRVSFSGKFSSYSGVCSLTTVPESTHSRNSRQDLYRRTLVQSYSGYETRLQMKLEFFRAQTNHVTRSTL